MRAYDQGVAEGGLCVCVCARARACVCAYVCIYMCVRAYDQGVAEGGLLGARRLLAFLAPQVDIQGSLVSRAI